MENNNTYNKTHSISNLNPKFNTLKVYIVYERTLILRNSLTDDYIVSYTILI